MSTRRTLIVCVIAVSALTLGLAVEATSAAQSNAVASTAKKKCKKKHGKKKCRRKTPASSVPTPPTKPPAPLTLTEDEARAQAEAWGEYIDASSTTSNGHEIFNCSRYSQFVVSCVLATYGHSEAGGVSSDIVCFWDVKSTRVGYNGIKRDLSSPLCSQM